jgi:hypothetical protein
MEGVKIMSVAFSGYADPFSVTHNNTTEQASFMNKVSKRLKRQNRILKQLKKQLKSNKKKKLEEKDDSSLWSKIKNAIVKSIPAAVSALAATLAKWFFFKK